MCLNAAHKYADRTEKTIRGVLDNGFLLWELQKPQQRLLSYRYVTDPRDTMWLLTDNYLDLWKTGAAPDLAVLTAYQQVQKPQPDPLTGQMVPVPINDLLKYFWAVLLAGLPPDASGLVVAPPPFVFEKFQKDFIHQEKEDAKKVTA